MEVQGKDFEMGGKVSKPPPIFKKTGSKDLPKCRSLGCAAPFRGLCLRSQGLTTGALWAFWSKSQNYAFNFDYVLGQAAKNIACLCLVGLACSFFLL